MPYDCGGEIGLISLDLVKGRSAFVYGVCVC